MQRVVSNPWSALLVLLAALCAASPSRGGGAFTAPADAAAPGAVVGAVEGISGGNDLSSPPMMPGWPQAMGIQALYRPVGVVLADVDNDHDLEVLAGSTDSRLYVWNHDGTPYPGWPASVGGQVQSKPAAADLDGDGDLEIAVAIKNGQIRILHHTGAALAGWPQSTANSYGFLSPVIYDLDGDHRPEVLMGGGSNVYAWRADGTPMPGFPRATGSNVTGTLAVGDITGDGSPEILAVTLAGTLQAFQADGSIPPGWPASFGLSNSWAAPSIGDIDGDGDREAFVVGYVFGSQTRIYGYHGDGTAVSGFPLVYPSVQTYSCPVLGDTDGDGDLEIFNAGKISGDNPPTFYGWDHSGDLLPGWPTQADPNMEGSAIIVDFSGDARMEAAIGDNWNPGVIFGYNLDGTVAAPDFPIPKPGASGPNAPEVADVDGDGDLDLAMTMMTGDVALWSFDTPWDEARVEWGGLFHDAWNTNQHGFRPLGPADAPISALAPRLTLDALGPNPFAHAARTAFTLPRDGFARVSVHDAAGRLVRVLFEGISPAGTHALAWDGRDGAGSSAPAGCYFVRLAVPGEAPRAARVSLVR